MTKIIASFLLLSLAVLTGVVGSQSSTGAQEATPVTSDCPTTTPGQNLVLIVTYFEAVEAGDIATMDEILNEDYSDNISDSPNEPGNQDELAQFQALALTDLSVNQVFASGNWVAYSFTFVVDADKVTVIGISRFECGGVATSYFEFERTAIES